MPRWIPGQDRQHPWGKTMKKTEDMQFLEPTTSYGHWPCQCGNWTRWNPAKIMLCMVIAKTLTRNQAGNMDIVCIAIHFVGVCWAAPSGMLLDVLKFWEHARVFVLRASAGFLRKLGWLVALPSECIESQWIMIAVSGWRSMLDTKKTTGYVLLIVILYISWWFRMYSIVFLSFQRHVYWNVGKHVPPVWKMFITKIMSVKTWCILAICWPYKTAIFDG